MLNDPSDPIEVFCKRVGLPILHNLKSFAEDGHLKTVSNLLSDFQYYQRIQTNVIPQTPTSTPEFFQPTPFDDTFSYNIALPALKQIKLALEQTHLLSASAQITNLQLLIFQHYEKHKHASVTAAKASASPSKSPT